MKHVVSGWLLRCAKRCNTHPKLEPHAGACDDLWSSARHWEKCACDEVFRLQTPSRARHSLMSVREVCEKNLGGIERVCSHHSFHQCWSRHWVSWCSRHWVSWCSCCDHWCEDDEEEVCDQWFFEFLAVPVQVCSQCFIEWSLACSFFLRDIDVLSSLFSLKSCEILRSGLKNLFALASVQLAHHHWIPVR